MLLIAAVEVLAGAIGSAETAAHLRRVADAVEDGMSVPPPTVN
ncbi:MAG TPA: hypothetical protein VF329_03505 [Gammaproteobacteria bacterium]